jgi:Delta7-sterol 5-desaturase
MLDLQSVKFFLEFFFSFNAIYLIVLPVLLLLWAIVFPKFIKHRKNYPFKPIKAFTPQLRRELFYTIISLFIFAGITLYLSFALKGIGYYDGYPEITGIWGYVYAAFTLVAMFLWHDTFFFWTHKTMHHPMLFRYTHKVHHLSKDIEPLSSISFHPIEAVVQSFWSVPLLLILPISLPVIITYGVLEAIHTFYGHSGYELYPSGFTKHWLGKHIATSTHHNYHHERVGGHYGLYFTWWDKLTNKEFSDYHERFEELASGKNKKILSAE